MCRLRIVTIESIEEQQQRDHDDKLDQSFGPHSSLNSASSDCLSSSDSHPAVFQHQPYIPHFEMNYICDYQESTPSPMRAPYQRQIKPWTLMPIPQDWRTAAHFEGGCIFELFDSKLSNHFKIDSRSVVPTIGAIRYMENYNENGPYTRQRFQLCNRFQKGACTKGADCSYIHSAEVLKATTVHSFGDASHECLPAGLLLPIYSPHSNCPPQIVPSDSVLVTDGSAKLAAAVSCGNAHLFQRPQHCAHYQFKKVCHRGNECSFIHCLIPPCE